ncbi:MAG: ATP-binding protein [Neobacillus sp.]
MASISDQGLDVANWLKPPYRSPHHTASAAALVGGVRSINICEYP